jgi:hypothetical protein
VAGKQLQLALAAVVWQMCDAVAAQCTKALLTLLTLLLLLLFFVFRLLCEELKHLYVAITRAKVGCA